MSRIGLMQEFAGWRKARAESAKSAARCRAQRSGRRGGHARRPARDRDRVARAPVSAEIERAVAEQIAEADLVVGTAMSAYRAGKTPQVDVIAGAGRSHRSVQPRHRRGDAVEARAHRARPLYRRRRRPVPGEPPDVSRLPFDETLLRDVEAQPEIRLARAQESAAATAADLARAAKHPDWSAELSYAVRGSSYSNMVSLMFSIDLPWSPGTRQDREYAARLEGARCRAGNAGDTVRMRTAEVESMRAEWEAARIQAAAHPRRHAAARRAAARGRARGVPRRHRSARGRARCPSCGP